MQKQKSVELGIQGIVRRKIFTLDSPMMLFAMKMGMAGRQ